jgi:hypothetical protein
MPLLRRMINLEELHLNIIVKCFDGDILKENIIICMPRLHKFTFSICSIINHNDKTNLPLKEYIQETFKDFFNNQIISCIDHFQEEGFSQYHIYTYPYKSYFYSNITNDFQGGLFLSVTKVSLFDERPFEYEFFLQIQKSFPLIKKLKINNRKPQNEKQEVISNNDNHILSIIEYSNLTQLDLFKTHDDYLELFLFDTKISLPNDLHLYVDYQSLKRVTYYFTRCITRYNYPKIAFLYIHSLDSIDEHIKNYFARTFICPISFASSE